MTDNQNTISILYDGDCPFCSRYVSWLRLKKNLGVSLVDARGNSALKDEATKAGYDLDHGMLVRYGGRDYYADEAILLLSLLATPANFFNKTAAAFFRSPRRARAVYPLLSFARRMTVRILGRGMIGNLRSKNQ